MKTYIGERDSEGTLSVYVKEPGKRRKLNPQFKIRNHSPNGFECGYAGSGPAQLALAICVDALKNSDQAQKIYQVFKFKVIANLPRDGGWELTETQVLEAIAGVDLGDASQTSPSS